MSKRNHHRNQYRIVDSTTAAVIIFDPANKPVEFLLDTIDLGKVAPYQWCLIRRKHGQYAYRKLNGVRTQYLHRVLTNAPDGRDIDHRSRIAADCRQSNLRVVMRNQNQQNRGVMGSSKLGIKGVIINCNRYQAQISIGHKVIVLGRYLTALKAALAYDAAAIEHFGEFACTNESLGLLDKASALPGITSSEAFGSVIVTLSGAPQTLTLTGIPSPEAFGSAAWNPTVALTFSGIPSAEAFGSLTESPTISLSLAGIPSAEAFGQPRLDVVVSLTGIGSAEAFGAPTVSASNQFILAGIPSTEAFGTPTYDLTFPLAGIESEEAFGSVAIQLGMNISISLHGIPSAEALGVPTWSPVINLGLTGIDTEEAFGFTDLEPTNHILVLFGIPSAEALGRATISQPQLVHAAMGRPAADPTRHAAGNRPVECPLRRYDRHVHL